MNTRIRISLILLLVFAGAGSFPLKAQARRAGQTRAPGSQQSSPGLVERGRYIVESVAMCERCHTQRDGNGNPDRVHWLMGGPVQTRPTYNDSKWALMEPRLAGSPPGTEDEFIKLLTTGISRTGLPPNPPMPPFRMTREDANAVLAYLKSLRQ